MSALVHPANADEPSAPVHSIEAEQAVLGSLLFDNAAWDRVGDILEPRHFWHAPHGVIFRTMAAMLVACKPADVVTVFEALQRSGEAESCGGLSYLNDLAQSVAGAGNVRRYAEIVAEHSMSRLLISASGQAMGVARGRATIESKLDAILSLFGQIDKHRVRKVPQSVAELAIRRTEFYEAVERGDIEPGWSTGIPSLDRLLNRLRPGALYILGARPKVGKTSLALWIARHLAAAGLPTLILSQEMPDTEIADRAVVQAGSIDYSALLSGKLTPDGWARAAEGLNRLAGLPLFVDDQPALTLGDIRTKARQVKGLKVLVVDYLQLCSGSGGDENRNAQIETLTRGLKALAKTQGIAVIALSQLNRAVETRSNKRPQLSDLRDSGAIEQDADAVMFMWPVRDFPNEGRRIIGLAVEANRQGPTGALALDFCGANQRWGESTASLEPPTATERSRGFE